MALLSYTKTPIWEIKDPLLVRAGVRLLIKREDLNHPHVSGNKWWKLRYNLDLARALGQTTLLTFGGAYSNHLYAVAVAGSELGLKSIGVVRGEPALPLNPTLSFVTAKGMLLHYLSRSRYREKSGDEVLQELHHLFGSFYMIPEGGTNEEAVRGCREFGKRLVNEVDFDILALPVGTGGTLAGMIQSLGPHQRAIGFSVLKDGAFLETAVQRWLPGTLPNWRMETRFDFGGFAKTNGVLTGFIERQQMDHALPLDKVYTGKTLFGVYSLIERGEIPKGSTVLMIHTGGLQGSN